MSRPKILDLFCGAGIGADGYLAAGFDVVGVDIRPQPNYPGTFVQADAMEWLDDAVAELWSPNYDVIHASPPCQLFTRAQHLRDAQGSQSKETVDLLTPTLELIVDSNVMWIVENVAGAPGMENATMLCGSSFGLGVRRHRYFLSNRPLIGKPCDHKGQGRPWGVYHVPGDSIPAGGRTARNLEHGKEVMGVAADRPCTWDELKEGVPPAYTEHLGRQLLAHLEVAA